MEGEDPHGTKDLHSTPTHEMIERVMREARGGGARLEGGAKPRMDGMESEEIFSTDSL